MKPTSSAIRKNFKTAIFTILIIEFLSVNLFGQEFSGSSTNNYQQIYGVKYKEALQFISDNPWMKDTIQASNLDPDFVLAIVFPELIRYSEIQDKLEVSGLLSLYVQYGERYADFSVGRFQMKPTFVEKIEKDAAKLYLAHNYDFSDSPDARLKRVIRLESINSQLTYLILFIQIMNFKFKNLQWINKIEKLKFYATAYNVGYWLGEENIKLTGSRNMFYTGIIKGQECYNYADIAWYYYLSKQN